MDVKPIIFETAFNTYHSVDLIGEGANGRVYGVEDSTGMAFALKLLKAEVVGREEESGSKTKFSFAKIRNTQIFSKFWILVFWD